MTGKLSVQEKMQRVRKEFEERFKAFRLLLDDKVLKRNKSDATLLQEKKVLDDLASTCLKVDKMNVGEGLFAFSTVGVRSHMLMRDRINELEYELFTLRKEVAALKKEKSK